MTMRSWGRMFALASALLAGGVTLGCADTSAEVAPAGVAMEMADAAAAQTMAATDVHAGHAVIPAGLATAVPAPGGSAAPAATEMTVYLTPTCACCAGWVEHMRAAGFTVTTIYQDDLTEVRRRHRVPDDVISCHLGIVGDYLVEGHVPADVVTRLLDERPRIAGIAVPGMVTGTPGMEHPSGHADPYDIVSFDERGAVGVYESRR